KDGLGDKNNNNRHTTSFLAFIATPTLYRSTYRIPGLVRGPAAALGIRPLSQPSRPLPRMSALEVLNRQGRTYGTLQTSGGRWPSLDTTCSLFVRDAAELHLGLQHGSLSSQK